MFISRCLSTGEIQSPIACVHCHPRLSNYMIVVFCNGSLLSFSPLSSTEPISQTSVSIPEACPLSVCFGSGIGSDQFALYVLYSTGDVGIEMPFYIEGYQLPMKAYASLIEEGHTELNEWLYSWEQCNEKYMRSVSSRQMGMPFVIMKQSEVDGKPLDVVGKQPNVTSKQFGVNGKQLDVNGKQLDVNGKQFGVATKQLSVAGKQLSVTNKQLGVSEIQPDISLKQSDNLPSTNRFQSGQIRMFEYLLLFTSRQPLSTDVVAVFCILDHSTLRISLRCIKEPCASDVLMERRYHS